MNDVKGSVLARRDTHFAFRHWRAVLFLALWLGFASVGHRLGAAPAEPVAMRIDAAHTMHTMAGGMGASWHALGPTVYWYEDLLGPGRINRTSRGSAFGGNPPLSYTKAWDYYKDVCAEPVPYYGYGILTRFTAKHSHTLEVQGNSEQTKAAALLSPHGNLTIMVLNKAENERMVSLSVIGLRAGCTVYKYQVTEAAVGRLDYRMEPLQAFAISPDRTEIGESLPAQSITVYSTYKLADADPGIVAED